MQFRGGIRHTQNQFPSERLVQAVSLTHNQQHFALGVVSSTYLELKSCKLYSVTDWSFMLSYQRVQPMMQEAVRSYSDLQTLPYRYIYKKRVKNHLQPNELNTLIMWHCLMCEGMCDFPPLNPTWHTRHSCVKSRNSPTMSHMKETKLLAIMTVIIHWDFHQFLQHPRVPLPVQHQLLQ